MSSTGGGDDKWYAPVPMLSIDSRGGCGPAWSPDGTKMAAIYEGVLAVWPVSPAGEPLGPPRRVTTESAHSPSWAGDSRHILYQSLDKLRIVDIETGEARTVPLDLKYTPGVPTGRIVVHAGKLVDMKSPTPRTERGHRSIEGNRIVARRAARRRQPRRGATSSTRSNLTVMPGLIEFHSHLQKDFGEAQGRAWLAFGITTVRSPGNTPYEAVEDREANEAGVRPGPRVYGTGYLMEWQRVYYKMGIAISSVAQLEMELQRAKVLQHDLIKSYVRLPDLQQKRMVEFAHSIGIPVATHEIYPAAFVGVDNTEHTVRDQPPRLLAEDGDAAAAYEDVVQLFGKSRRIFCPMISGGGARKLFEQDPALQERSALQAVSGVDSAAGRGAAGGGQSRRRRRSDRRQRQDGARRHERRRPGRRRHRHAERINLHGELMAYMMAGMSNFDALKAATVNPAKALGLDAGTIEAGKLADLVVVDGDPLANIANTTK